MNVRHEVDSRPIYLEICLDDPQLVLSSFTTNRSEVLEVEFQPTEEQGWGCAFVIVEDGDRESLVAAFESDPTVAEVEFLGDIGDNHRFRVRFADGVSLVPPSTTEMGVQVLSIRYKRDSWFIQLHLPVHSALHRVQSYYHDHDITFRVKRLHIARDTDVGAETMLLPSQHEVLLVAYRNGYFDVPRKASQRELADRLGISKSGVSQRIRRAVSRLIETTLSP